MTFSRRLAAVLLVVAVVVALGVAWEHSGAAGWITPPGPGRGPAKVMTQGAPAHPPPGAVLAQGGGPVFRTHPADPGNGLGPDMSDVGNLTTTTEIEVAVVAGVVLLDVVRRRQRRTRRIQPPGHTPP